MQIVGEQIRLARLRRNLSIAQIAERATCSPLTVTGINFRIYPYRNLLTTSLDVKTLNAIILFIMLIFYR